MELIIFLIFAALVVVPLYQVLPLFRINSLWALVAVFPLGLIILLWVMSARRDQVNGAS
jgi:hypothetical protein